MTDEKEKSYSDKLAEDRTDLAKDRTDLAQNRTFLAAERTYSAWIRTGFTVSGAGLTIGKALQDMENGEIALLIGGMLIAIGMLAFIYAWYGYLSEYNYLKNAFPDHSLKRHPYRLNLMVISFLTLILLVVCILGFWFMLS